MNKFHIFSLICLITGIVFFTLSVLYGDVETGVFIIFPFLSGSGVYAFLGFIFIFIAILLFMLGSTTNVFRSDEFEVDPKEYQPHKKSSMKSGGVVLIGPIPIIFGSNWKIAIILTIAAIILILVAFFAFRII